MSVLNDYQIPEKAYFCKLISIVQIYFLLNNNFLVQPNFHPERNCTENEYECENSYGYKICVQEEHKTVACAKYSKIFCNDEAFFYRYYDKTRWLFRNF